MKTKLFFNRIGRFICTKEIFEDRVLSLRMYKYFLIGMLVRLSLLPFFFQRDILSTYQRAAETVFAGNIGADFQQFLTHIIHSGYLFIIKPFLPAADQLQAILLNQDSWTSWIDFNSMDYVYRMLSMFKLPYLLLDIACMFLIIRFLFDGDPEKRLKVFKYWVLNPLVIFVLYIFARHDIMGIFVTLIALLLAKNNKKYWAIIILAAWHCPAVFPCDDTAVFNSLSCKEEKRLHHIFFYRDSRSFSSRSIFLHLFWKKRYLFTSKYPAF